MIKSQELIDRLRYELNLSKTEFSDNEIWKNSKDSFMCARINLGMELSKFKKEIIKAFKVPYNFLGKKK